MQEPVIDRQELEVWANYLLEHSLGGIAPADRVMIKGERIAWPLLEILERKVIEAGALPDLYLVPPNNERGRVWSAAMGAHGTAEQLATTPEWHAARYAAMTKYVEVLGAESPDSYSGLAPDRSGALAAADQPFAAIRLAKPWVITLYPTPRHAEMEGFSLDEYVEFIVRASTTDPEPLRQAEERLVPLMESAKEMKIVTRCPHQDRDLTLTLNLEPSLPMISYGLRNFPDGEIFTSPDANSPSGEIFIDLAIRYGGRDIQGIFLKLESGRITDYKADLGHEQLAAIIETDEGSHRLGEVALGMNPGLDRVLKHPLFVEKVGGTLHVAIGKSYDVCYVKDPASAEGKQKLDELAAAGIANESAQHVDIVADFRPGGCGRRVWLDDTELVVQEGVWVPAGRGADSGRL